MEQSGCSWLQGKDVDKTQEHLPSVLSGFGFFSFN
jgi:hypothetical protein